MADVITCPYCGAQVYDRDGNGVQQCEYCRNVIEFDKRHTAHDISRAVPPIPNMTEPHMPDRRKKWKRETVWLMIIHAVLVIFLCIAVETDNNSVGGIVLIFDFLFAFMAATRIGMTVPTSKVLNKFLHVLIFNIIVFLEFWAVLFVGAMFTALISRK